MSMVAFRVRIGVLLLNRGQSATIYFYEEAESVVLLQ